MQKRYIKKEMREFNRRHKIKREKDIKNTHTRTEICRGKNTKMERKKII